MQESKELQTQAVRVGIAVLAQQMIDAVDIPKVELEVMHHFLPGIYIRTVLMKAGDTVVGKIHKKSHLVIVSAGKARVVSEEFGGQIIESPAIFKSPPGVRRALQIEEDMVWTTVHENPTNTEDLIVLEDELIAKNYDEVKR